MAGKRSRSTILGWRFGISCAGSSGGSAEEPRRQPGPAIDRVWSLCRGQWQDSAGYSVFPLDLACALRRARTPWMASWWSVNPRFSRLLTGHQGLHAGNDDGFPCCCIERVGAASGRANGFVSNCGTGWHGKSGIVSTPTRADMPRSAQLRLDWRVRRRIFSSLTRHGREVTLPISAVKWSRSTSSTPVVQCRKSARGSPRTSLPYSDVSRQRSAGTDAAVNHDRPAVGHARSSRRLC